MTCPFIEERQPEKTEKKKGTSSNKFLMAREKNEEP